jgi:hypothetical protein
MLNLGALAFLNPWLLLGLGLLPVLWWLLRVTPPAPRRVRFPALRLLLKLNAEQETPAHTPLWLLALRLLLAALLILALAHPLANPGARLTGSGPLVLVVDDGWSAANHWQARSRALGDLLDQAERAHRPALLLPTAPPASGDLIQPSKLLSAAELRPLAQALQPMPWGDDRAAAIRAIGDLSLPAAAEIVWLTDGIDDGAAAKLAERLQQLGSLAVLRDDAPNLARALLPPQIDGENFTVKALRPTAGAAEAVWVRASAERGQVLARQPIAFKPEETAASIALTVPTEIRNRLTRVEIEGQQTAGGTVLLDERWRRRPVGIVSGGSLETEQPLLSDTYYVARALAPFAEVRTGSISDLLQRELAVLVLADVGQVVGPERQALEAWMNKGGVLVRFAGPRLAANADDLIPVPLRAGGRMLGGALSWEQPAKLAPFGESSPFHGLAIPADVLVNRQVLAEPSLDLANRTWARLLDGTPLVTAAKRGDGLLVLFHTTANTQWSNLALSGLFVEMLRRIVNESQGIAGADGRAPLPPLALLDGFGHLGAPGPAAVPIVANEIATTRAGPKHPPGFYGSDDARRALNLTASISALKPIGSFPGNVETRPFSDSRELDLLPWLLTAAIILGIVDLIAALALRGLIRPALRRASIGAVVLLGVAVAGLAGGSNVQAQTKTDDSFALNASLDLRLVYVLTGNAEVDAMSRAGMIGLTSILAQRTSVEAAEPMAIDIEKDEILFFPLIYWPMAIEQPELSAKALAKIDGYMKTGGIILFDTRDQDVGGGFGEGRLGSGTSVLRHILSRLDVPPLTPVPEDHILTKAFYLTQDFPGRWSGGQVWVERYAGQSNDGVSPLVIGSNDWAAAWATDADGRPLAAVVPGGASQREHAYRFGVNLMMYALTGNYKADQVHVPALLERLGQ